MFTRRHYIKIAELIQKSWMTEAGTPGHLTWARALCDDACAMFAQDNPNFDAKKFRAACFK